MYLLASLSTKHDFFFKCRALILDQQVVFAGVYGLDEISYSSLIIFRTLNECSFHFFCFSRPVSMFEFPRTIQVLLLPPTIFVRYIMVVLKLQGQIRFDSIRSKDILMQGF